MPFSFALFVFLLSSLVGRKLGKYNFVTFLRTIFASGGLGLLQMVLGLDIEQCASEDTETRRGVGL